MAGTVKKQEVKVQYNQQYNVKSKQSRDLDSIYVAAITTFLQALVSY